MAHKKKEDLFVAVPNEKSFTSEKRAREHAEQLLEGDEYKLVEIAKVIGALEKQENTG